MIAQILGRKLTVRDAVTAFCAVLVVIGLGLFGGYYHYAPTRGPELLAIAEEEVEHPAHVKVTLSISKEVILVGKPYRVQVTAKNLRDVPAWGVLEVRVGSAIERSWDVRLSGKENQTFRYNTTKSEPGLYRYKGRMRFLGWSAESKAVPLKAIYPREIQLSAEASESTVPAQGEFTICGRVLNSSPVSVEGVLNLLEKKSVVETWKVSLPPAGERTYSKTLVRAAGTYTYGFELDAYGFKFKSNEVGVSVYNPGANASVAISSSASKVIRGEHYTIAATAKNPSNAEVSGTLELEGNGRIVKTFDVTLPAGGSKKYGSEESPDPGEYRYKARLTVDGVEHESSMIEVNVRGLRAEDIHLSLSTQKGEARINEIFRLQVKIRNRGPIAVDGTLSILKLGKIIQTFGVKLAGGEEKLFSLRWAESKKRNYEYKAKAEVDGAVTESGSVSVHCYELGEKVSVSLGTLRSESLVGHPIRLQAVVVNYHDEPVKGTLELQRTAVLQTFPFALGANSSKQFAYQWTPGEEGLNQFKAVVRVGPYRHLDETQVRVTELKGRVQMKLEVPEKVEPIKPYFIRTSCLNGTNRSIEGTLAVYASGIAERSREVRVGAGENLEIAFREHKDVEGLIGYVAKLETPVASFSSGTHILRVREHLLRKVAGVAGTANGIPIAPAVLTCLGVAGLAVSRRRLR